MTNRAHVAVVLGVAGLAVAAAQALLLSSPPTWFQLAVVVFWTLVGGAYLASGLGQRLRARWGTRRSRVPDGEVSTGGPEPDADTTRGADVDPARPATAGPVPDPPVAEPAAPRDEDATAVVPPLPTAPVRAARPRADRPRTTPFALPGVRPAAPLAGAAGRPAPPPLSGAAPPPLPTDAETTDTRMAPWPLAASPVAPTARSVTAPARPETHPTTIVPAPVPAVPAPDAPASAPVTSRPVTSPSFAIRAARSPFSFGAATATTPPASGRHAVPEVEPEVEPAGASRQRRRHRAAAREQATMAGSATSSRTERAHRRRAS